MMAPETSAISFHFVVYPRFANNSAATPVDASRPYSDPPAKQIALITVRYSPLMPGDPPRTSICIDASFGKWNTVQPVGPSAYSATPISRPGRSRSSTRRAAMSVRGLRCRLSLLITPRSRTKCRAQARVRCDADRGRGQDLGGDHRVAVRKIGRRRLAHDMRMAGDRFLAHREPDVVRRRDLRHVAEVCRRENELAADHVQPTSLQLVG